MAITNDSPRRGASLVEMLVVIGIVGVLIAFSTVALVRVGIDFTNRLEARVNSTRNKTVHASRKLLQPARGRLLADRYIVILKDDADAQQAIVRLGRQTNIKLIHRYTHAFNGFAAEISAASVTLLLQDPAVQYVEQDQTLSLAATAKSMNLRRINALPLTSPSVPGGREDVDMPTRPVDADIAIIDTGVDLTALDVNIVLRKGFGCTEDARDTDGHGTQVAAVAAARANDFGVLGVAAGARIWALKVANADNGGAASNLIAALDYVITQADEIDVANISLTTGRSVAVNMAAANCVRAGVLVVAAAGNDRRDAAQSSPGSEPSVITVAALVDTDGKVGGKGAASSAGDPDDTLASFSNHGAVVDFLAPGVQVETIDLDNQVVRGNGTSLAAAHVSGLAAVLRDGQDLFARRRQPTAEDLAARLHDLVKERIPGPGRWQPYPIANRALPLPPSTPAGVGALTHSYPIGLPITYEPNYGQLHPHARFVARGRGYAAYLTSDGLVFSPRKAPPQRVQFANANPNPAAAGLALMPGVANYFLGRDPSRWRTNIPTYGQVRYRQVYPGIDVLFTSDAGRPRYDFLVAPGADPSLITLNFPDAASVKVERVGSLQIELSGVNGDLVQTAPVMFQMGAYGLEAVRGRYVAVGPKQVRFEIGEYDRSRELIIDPVLFSTFLGGSSSDGIYSMAADPAGNIYVGGSTNSANFPVVGGVDATNNGQDVFITKINAAGTAIVYSTYLGGSGSDGPVFGGLGIAVDIGGQVAITSETSSNDFPVVSPHQAAIVFFNDAFVTRLNAAGNGIIFSTYLGGGGFDFGNACACDNTGAVYVTGASTGAGFPTTAGAYQKTYGGGGLKGDGYVAKFTPGGALVYSTFLGGSAEEEGHAITVLGGNAYAAGFTESANFPALAGSYQTTFGGVKDMYVAQINSTGGAVYCTFLGGSGTDGRGTFPFGGPMGIAVDAGGNAVIASGSDSANYPVTPGAFQTANAGAVDAVVTKLNAAGNGLVYSTYLGGSGNDIAYAITLDPSGNAYIAGDTASANIPRVNPVQGYIAPFSNVLVSVLNPGATGLLFSTPVGSGIDTGRGVAVGAAGVWVAGNAGSGFPQVKPLMPVPGAGDGFVAIVSPSFAGVVVAQTGTTDVTEGGATDTYSIVLNSPPSANVTITMTPGPQLSVAPATLTFTPANWATPQNVTVTAVNDVVVEGLHSGTITHAAASADTLYNGIAIASVTATITDNDFPPGVNIVESGGFTRVTEGGGGDTYTVVLNSLPTASVTITLNPGTQLTVAPLTLTFTTLNWNVPQTVTVNAVDDALIEKNPHPGTITHTAASADLTYNGITVSVTATIVENDFPPPDVADTSEAATYMGVLVGTKTHKGVDTMRHDNGKFDDDWYAWDMSKGGVLTVNVSNVKVFASGPKGQSTFGDVHFRVYRVVSGNLIQLGASQVNGKTISVQVMPGERILVWAYGLYFTQAQYDLAVDLN